jgi:ABC-type glycerol-3-phosphate transport system permease component
MRSKNRTLTILVVLTLAFLTVAYVLPMYVVVMTSLKTPAEISARRYLIPSTNLQFQNYVDSFKLILPALKNS